MANPPHRLTFASDYMEGAHPLILQRLAEASLVKSAGYLIFWVMIIRALMSWVSQGRSPIDYVMYQLTEPLMAPIRRIIPAMGGIDFSAMVVILILYLINYLGMDLFGELWFLL